MKYQFSAGGVVFKTQTATSGQEEILILVCQHAQHHGWVFPKGKIGDTIANEGKKDAAVREVEEETGITAKILQPLSPISYWYMWGKEKRKKTVYYFLMEFVDGNIAEHDDEMEQVEWIPAEDVNNRLTYPTDKEVWEEAKPLIVNPKSEARNSKQ